MAFRVVLLAVALLMLALSTQQTVEAKSPSFILTGGELGEYAAVVYPPWPEGPYKPFGAPASQLVSIVGPEELSALRYEIYEPGPYQAVYGPDYHYYPAERILYDTEYDHWFDVLSEWAAFMESAIDEALAERARGELEAGPLAAGLRQYHIPDGAIWLRAYAAGEEIEYSASLSFGRCPECIGIVGRPEQFVMRDMVATLGNAPIAGGSQRDPSYVLEYYASYGGGGSGGVAGFYAPPVDDTNGRFWPPAYMHNPGVAYFETTPGFDAAIARALADPYARAPEASAIGTDDSGFRATAVGAALLAVVLGVGVIGGFARRRG